MKILILSICLFTAYTSLSQNDPTIERILKLNRTSISKIDAAASRTTFLIPSSFAQNNLVHDQTITDVKDLTVLKVYYVYTKYKQSALFDQMALDRNRLETLARSFPEIVNDPFIEWELVEQTGCDSPENGSDYFHGFIVIHRPILDENERLAEIKRLESYLKNPTDTYTQENLDLIGSKLHPTTGTTASTPIISDQIAHYKDGPDAMLDYLKRELRTDAIALKRDDQWVKTKIKIAKTGEISNVTIIGEQPERIKNAVIQAITMMPNWEPARKDTLPIDSELNLELRVSYSPSVNGMYLINGQRPSLETNTLEEKPSELISIYPGSSPEEIFLRQAVVYKGMDALDRNERCALVMDVTGSMTEHVVAMKRWLHKNNDSIKFTSFTFFNDGDDKPSRKKTIGGTGGIYLTNNIRSIDQLITETMRRGSGGERSESDVEALLYTQVHDTLCDAILLIGDNYSEIRDIELFKDVKKKINVLICTNKTSIRPEYLMIAKKSGGYFVFNGEYINLQIIQKGQILSIGSYQYDYDGHFFTLRDTKESDTRMN